jgi:hypothetical protein
VPDATAAEGGRRGIEPRGWHEGLPYAPRHSRRHWGEATAQASVQNGSAASKPLRSGYKPQKRPRQYPPLIFPLSGLFSRTVNVRQTVV